MHSANDDRDKTIWTITTDLTSKVAETRKKDKLNSIHKLTSTIISNLNV